MRNKNLLVILLIVIVIAVAAAAALIIPRVLPQTLPEDSLLTAKGYVYISAGGEGRWFELPEEESPLTLRRTKADGTVLENTVHLTPEGVYMASSTCDNQDCVEQGLVTLENMDTRVLRNLIVCLPNEVGIELYSAGELQSMLDAEAQTAE